MPLALFGLPLISIFLIITSFKLCFVSLVIHIQKGLYYSTVPLFYCIVITNGFRSTLVST